MPSTSSIICFDRLPIELIHKIFNYLQCYDIFLSCYNLNTYINMVINTYDRYQLNLQSITMSNFYLTLEYINPCQVISLTLSNMDDTPGQYQLFLSLFSLKQFSRLESLQLIHPTHFIDLNQILTDLSSLHFLKSLTILQCQPTSINQQTFLLLSSFLNQSKSLHRLYLSGTLNPIFDYNFTSSIRYLYFNDNIFNTITFETITNHMPYLTSLDTAITLNTHSISSSLINLTRLIVTIFINLTNLEIKMLLNPMLSLKYLKILANGKQWFNGHYWEECLPLNIQTFQFNFSTQSIHINEENIIETFQTKYWLEKKQWFVMLDYQMNPTMTHLYSLPYCDTQFYYRPTMNINRQFHSTVPIEKSYLHNVTKLTVDLTTLITESNSSLTSTHYFSNVTSLILADTECHSVIEPLFYFLKSIIDLHHITELKLGQFHHPDLINILFKHLPNLSSLRITEHMLIELHMLNFHHIHTLNICGCLTDIEKLCLMFPNVKTLCVKLLTFEQMKQVMDLLKNSLINITFRQINQESKEQIIKWLYEDGRRFSYDIDEHMNLYIWLTDSLI